MAKCHHNISLMESLEYEQKCMLIFSFNEYFDMADTYWSNQSTMMPIKMDPIGLRQRSPNFFTSRAALLHKYRF